MNRISESQAKYILEALKALQQRGELLCCPRCGCLAADMSAKALSRHADVYICDSCGTEEALLDWMGHPRPLKEWALIKGEDAAAEGSDTA